MLTPTVRVLILSSVFLGAAPQVISLFVALVSPFVWGAGVADPAFAIAVTKELRRVLLAATAAAIYISLIQRADKPLFPQLFFVFVASNVCAIAIEGLLGGSMVDAIPTSYYAIHLAIIAIAAIVWKIFRRAL